jgi:cytosine/adenosine deaminase-related metal-dependent hydrolase
MLVTGGTTTVGDIEAVPDLLPALWQRTPLRVVSFLEMTGVRSRRAPRAILAEAVARAGRLRRRRCAVGLSPHAPYSTTPELQRLCREAAAERGWRVSVHVAESVEESEMFVNRRGPMFEWLRRNERDMGDCGGVTPVQALARAGALGDHLLAIHANYVDAADMAELARAGVRVVHCPRSHAYFGHERFPAQALARAGVEVSLGTDSLATVAKRRGEEVRMDMRAEMRRFGEVHPVFGFESVLRMGTVHAARALGWGGQVGELVTGAHADLMAVPYAGGTGEVYAGIVGHIGPVFAVMIGGRWVHGPFAAGV